MGAIDAQLKDALKKVQQNRRTSPHSGNSMANGL